jgi:hypothetical protein
MSGEKSNLLVLVCSGKETLSSYVGASGFQYNVLGLLSEFFYSDLSWQKKLIFVERQSFYESDLEQLIEIISD